jgi:hypothetical protein
VKGDLFTSIRSACAAVARRAKHVRINTAGLADYAAGLPVDQVLQPTLDPASHFLGSEADTAAFFLVLDAINFGSGYFPHLAKLPGKSGYFTIATCLTTWFRSAVPTAETLCRLGLDDCAMIFGQPMQDPAAAELMGLFAKALNDLGRLLQEQFNGSAAGMIAAANGSAATLINLLAQMPFFRDIQRYGDLEVPFFKRAQLTVADLNLAFKGQGLGRFADLDRLTIFADNLVPHVLHMDGILSYCDDLGARINQGQLIVQGSAEEIEIRACALTAVEQICVRLGQNGFDVRPRWLDYLFWHRGQQLCYKAKPRHRCRSVYY